MSTDTLARPRDLLRRLRPATGTSLGALRLLVMLCIAVPLLQLVAFAGFHYQQLEAEADMRLQRALRISHEHATRIWSINESLLNHVRELAAIYDGPSGVTPEAMAARLHGLVQGHPQLHSISIHDRDGRLWASSRLDAPQPDAGIADRGYFRWHALGRPGSHLSEVLTDQRSGDRFIVMSVGRRTREGGFAGVVSVHMAPDYFGKFHAAIAAQEPGFAITLFRQDGVVYSRWPALPGAPARIAPSSEVLGRVLEGDKAGTLRSVSSLDGQRRMVLFERIENYPVYIGVGREVGAVARDLADEMALLTAVAGVPVLGIVLAAWLAMRRTRDSLSAAKRLQQESEARRQAEEALFQAQKMEALGRLTGGVAHDFNNALMVMSGNLHLLRRTGSERQARHLDAIGRAIDSATKLTRQLLAFSRHQALAPQTVSLQRQLPALRDLIGPTLGNKVELAIEVAGDTAAIDVDPAELELSLINLAVNARDAMPGGGSFTLRAANAARGDGGCGGADRVMLEARDTGSGMDADVATRAFDPFFTTKPPGKGTGLGLSQVYALCRRAGGSVTLHSAPDQGTTVRMCFPASRRPVPPVPGPDGPCEAIARHVLLVEDNLGVAEVTTEMLEASGCVVTHAANAQEALRALDACGFDVMLTDVVMPGGMDGAALAVTARARDPQLQVVIMTGYAEQIEAISRLGFRVLAKPFSPHALIEALAASPVMAPTV